MDYFQILLLTLHITQVLTKSKYKKYESSSSDEDSIENLLYYKDCQRIAKEEHTEPVMPLRYEAPTTPPPRQPDCPFPKMCCALSCGNECGNNQQSHITRQMEQVPNVHPVQPVQTNSQSIHPGMVPIQPPIQRRKKKIRFQPNQMQPPIGSRRSIPGLTKEKIKGLIAQDADIRKILKDLVRVTMQKVDLVEMFNSGKENIDNVNYAPESTPAVNFNEYDE